MSTKAFKILNKFRNLSSPHVVGGAVRDHLLERETNERETNDIDIATADRPDAVVDKLEASGIKTIDKLGKEHGTIFAVLDDLKEPIEITTFRKDINTDGRHAVVEFTDDLEEDLARRDFTINAMAMDLDGNIIDPFGGSRDLVQGVIRAVGDAEKRFDEDLLRILRAFRFEARYNFVTTPDIQEAAIDRAEDIIEFVSVERIVDEFDKAFKSPNPSSFIDRLHMIGFLQELIPEFGGLQELLQDPRHHPEGDVFSHILEVVDRANSNPDDRWAALLHDIGKAVTAEEVKLQKRKETYKEVTKGVGTRKNPPMYYSFHGHDKAGAEIVERVADDLKFSNDRSEKLVEATRLHMMPLYAENQGSPISDKQIRRFQDKAGKHLDFIQRLAEADHQRGDSDLFKDMPEPIEPLLKGRHLIERGHEPGPHFGPALDAAKQAQIDHGTTDIDELYEFYALPHLNN